MQKLRILTPGPTMMPPEVIAEMSRPMDHHRTPEHRKMLQVITEHLQYVYQTRGTCLTITGSGTAAMESAITAVCNPGGKALVTRNGKFSARWAKICGLYGIEHTICDLDWGCGAKAEHVADAIARDRRINTIVVTHSETSTAALSDLEAIANITRTRDCLLVVDGITSVGALPVKMDDWGVDLMVTSSQKALMTPPGLGMVAVSDRAWRRIESFDPPACYLSLKAYRKSLATDDSPYTPAITLMMGLRRALEMIREEGIEKIWARTARLARATRAAVEAMGLKSFPQDPVDSLTAICLPEGFDVPGLRKRLREGYGIIIAGGQDQLQGKIIRVNHMGYVDETDTLGFIGALELTLLSMGHQFTPGAGVTAAVEAIARN
jgi:serine---pyruvate transaminase